MRRTLFLPALLSLGAGPSSTAQDLTLRRGMPMVAARAMLKHIGARDISAHVGIVLGGEESGWFVLPDGTGIELLANSGSPGDSRGPLIIAIELGEKRQGYAGKILWLQQNTTTPDRVNLSDYLTRHSKIRIGMRVAEAITLLANHKSSGNVSASLYLAEGKEPPANEVGLFRLADGSRIRLIADGDRNLLSSCIERIDVGGGESDRWSLDDWATRVMNRSQVLDLLDHQ